VLLEGDVIHFQQEFRLLVLKRSDLLQDPNYFGVQKNPFHRFTPITELDGAFSAIGVEIVELYVYLVQLQAISEKFPFFQRSGSSLRGSVPQRDPPYLQVMFQPLK
jgi:hypothetical protein